VNQFLYFPSHRAETKGNRSDLAQTLAQRVRQGDIVTRDDLFLLVDQLQSPASEFYLQALTLLLTGLTQVSEGPPLAFLKCGPGIRNQ